MKELGRVWSQFTAIGCAVLASTAVSAGTGSATVQSIKSGTASLSLDGNSWQSAQVGSAITENATLKTGPGSQVDVYLGLNGPLLRVSSDSIVTFSKLSHASGAGEVITSTEIQVKQGAAAGVVRKMGSASKYVVATAGGNFVVDGASYSVKASGEFTVSKGVAKAFRTVSGTKTPKMFVLQSGTTFDPAGANGYGVVMQTSANLASEVALQMDGMAINPANEIAESWAPDPEWLAAPRPFDESRAVSSPPWNVYSERIAEPLLIVTQVEPDLDD